MRDRRPPGRRAIGRLGRDGPSGAVLLLPLILLAALLRLPDLVHRSSWEADQGEVMLALWRWIHQGSIPLVGLEASLGGAHHGALFDDLLLPAALLDGAASPVPEITAIALAGVAAVPLAWWSALQVAPPGREAPWAAFTAALVTALSSGFVGASILLWNPSLLAPAVSAALGAAWRGWRQRSPRWWVVALAALAVVVQLHLLGWILAPPLAALAAADLCRRRPEGRRGLVAALAAGSAILVVAHLPLVVHELDTGGAELRRIGALVVHPSTSPFDPATQTAIIAVRILAWPWVGGLTTAPAAAATTAAALIVGAGAVVGAAVAPRLRQRRGRADAGVGGRHGGLVFLVLTLGWGMAALDVLAPDLAVVVDALPNDHHHAVLDPLVVLVGSLLLAALAARAPRGRWVAAGLLLAISGWNLAHEPLAPAPDGGFPAAVAAARRVVAATGPGSVGLLGLPSFKSTAALGYPLIRAGITVTDRADPERPLVLLCDDRFRTAIGRPCGGAAEAGVVDRLAMPYRIATRFSAAPGRWVTVYLPGDGEGVPSPP